MINQQAIQHVFMLKAEILYWKNPVKTSNQNRKVKGNKTTAGYHIVSFLFEGTKFKEKRSRITWALVNGKDPDGVIDHIDGDPHNDTLSNLRDVSRSENLRNNKRSRDGEIIGVCYDARYKHPWKVQFSIKGKTHYFGRYSTEAEAQKAAIKEYGRLFSCV